MYELLFVKQLSGIIMFSKDQNVEVQDEVAKLLMGEGFKIPVTLTPKIPGFLEIQEGRFQEAGKNKQEI